MHTTYIKLGDGERMPNKLLLKISVSDQYRLSNYHLHFLLGSAEG